MRTRAKLGEMCAQFLLDERSAHYKNWLASVEARDFQMEDLWLKISRPDFCNNDHGVVVKFLGDDLEAIASQMALSEKVQFFSKNYYNEEHDRWLWEEIDESEADYYSMALIDGKYWCFAPSYWSLVPQCPIVSFEEAEDIETRLLARAS